MPWSGSSRGGAPAATATPLLMAAVARRTTKMLSHRSSPQQLALARERGGRHGHCKVGARRNRPPRRGCRPGAGGGLQFYWAVVRAFPTPMVELEDRLHVSVLPDVANTWFADTHHSHFSELPVSVSCAYILPPIYTLTAWTCINLCRPAILNGPPRLWDWQPQVESYIAHPRYKDLVPSGSVYQQST